MVHPCMQVNVHKGPNRGESFCLAATVPKSGDMVLSLSGLPNVFWPETVGPGEACGGRVWVFERRDSIQG